MATNVKVVGTDLKQVTVKVNPGTYFTEILEQACEKLKVSHTKFLLKHKQRQLDLSQTFRHSGLPPGARLELVVRSNTPSAINVALQFPAPESTLFPNGRVSEKLPSNFTIWQVLRQFESGNASAGKNLNITARGVARTKNGVQSGSGQLYYEIPNVIIENRTLSTFTDFQKSLSQLGYNSGSVLLRLSFQATEQPLARAMAEIEQYFKSEEPSITQTPEEQPSASAVQAPESATASLRETAGPVESANQPSRVETSQPKPTSSDGAMDIDENSTSEQRSVKIFSAPTSSTPLAASQAVRDEDYTPDISHAKSHQKLLKSLGENKRLLSDQELEQKAAAEEAKVTAIKSIKIKVRFPDNFAAEWNFGPADSGANLYTEVRGQMANSSLPFRLVLPGAARTTIKDDDGSKLIRGYGMKAATLVNFVWDDGVPADVRRQPFLKDSAASQAQNLIVPDVPEIEVADDSKNAGPVEAPKPRNDGEGSVLKKPKWLKGFGKK
ncbi:GLUT4 regulating protein TUG-domain-containing protein [Xylariaceae sp. FL0255]|nr:GLUT4 regulating protein TUG-domain-containing protein [Xylariaceae sp. FL0255]